MIHLLAEASKRSIARVSEIHKPLFDKNGKSKLITENDLEKIYLWLPRFCKSLDPQLIFSTSIHGKI